MTYVTGANTPRTVWDQDRTLITGISNTSPITGSPEVGVVFRAPTSGKVEIICGGGGRDPGGVDRVFIAPEVYKTHNSRVVESPWGGTTPVMSAGGEYVTSPPETNFTWGSRITTLEGLVPGEEYYARVVYSVSAGADNEVAAREIIVKPIP